MSRAITPRRGFRVQEVACGAFFVLFCGGWDGGERAVSLAPAAIFVLTRNASEEGCEAGGVGGASLAIRVGMLTGKRPEPFFP